MSPAVPNSSPGLAGEALAGLSVEPMRRQPRQALPSTDSQWFKGEVEPHESGLRAWLWRTHPALREELDDIVQETYLRLIRAKAAGDVRCAKTFLFGIARNVALNLHRAGRGRSFIPVNDMEDNENLPAEDDVVNAVAHRQELALTAEAIGTLPGRCREIVELHALEGLSYREIAERLGIAEETVRVQIGRGIKKCMSILRKHQFRERNGL